MILKAIQKPVELNTVKKLIKRKDYKSLQDSIKRLDEEATGRDIFSSSTLFDTILLPSVPEAIEERMMQVLC